MNGRTPKRIDDPGEEREHAGVLVPIFKAKGEYGVLFTKRTNRVAHHKGQISFPGGAVDRKDKSFEDTALRETYEEIGLMSEDVDLLGRIDDARTLASNYIIHPFVGIVPFPYDFTINRKEVERLVEVPLRIFHPDNLKNKRSTARYQGVTYHTPAYAYGSDLIWGATAKIMENLMEMIGRKLPLNPRKK